MIEHERVVTTVPKAKAVKPLVDKMITLGKGDTLHARRRRPRFWNAGFREEAVRYVGTRFGQRNGGYTRIVRRASAKATARNRP